MPKKIDELFSPERLQSNWQKVGERREKPPAMDVREEQSVSEIFDQLQRLLQQRFSERMPWRSICFWMSCTPSLFPPFRPVVWIKPR